MPRVAATFGALVLAHLVFAFAMRGDFGTVGSLAVATVGIGALVIIGIPAFIAFRRRGWLAWWQFGAGGALMGLACAAPLAAAGATFAAALAPAFAALGMLHALLFWLAAVWHNRALAATKA